MTTRFEFKLPDLAEGMVEGEIVAWLVAPGDEVKDEQPMVEVMTDKATVTISSPRPGKVLELGFEAGDIAPVGATLFVLAVAGEGAAEVALAAQQAPAAAQDLPAARPSTQPAEREQTEGVLAAAGGGGAVAARAVEPVPRGGGRALATPATRRFAREVGVDIGQVAGTGPAGRVTREDVEAFAKGGAGPAAQTPRATPAPQLAAVAQAPAYSQPHSAPAYSPPRSATAEEVEERVKIRGLRRAIYETMSRSKATASHFTYVEEIDCTNLVAARERLKAAAEARGLRLNYLPFIAKAVLLALRQYPKMNASVDDAAGEMVMKRYFHLGIAAATEAGLTVPVVRHADQLTLIELGLKVGELADKARAGKLSPPESKGSTFTITSLGKTGGLFATPIINHPEVAILGIHKMEPRAVVRGGQIVARQMMNISLSFDHRVIDGHEGADFTQRIKHYLEDPELMLLEMV